MFRIPILGYFGSYFCPTIPPTHSFYLLTSKRVRTSNFWNTRNWRSYLWWGANWNSPEVELDDCNVYIWVFPKIMASPNHPWINRVFHHKPSILGYHHLRKHPYRSPIISNGCWKQCYWDWPPNHQAPDTFFSNKFHWLQNRRSTQLPGKIHHRFEASTRCLCLIKNIQNPYFVCISLWKHYLIQLKISMISLSFTLLLLTQVIVSNPNAAATWWEWWKLMNKGFKAMQRWDFIRAFSEHLH